MGKPRQQVISRFFAPKPSPSSPPPPPKISATVSFSPSKRPRSQTPAPSPKKPKPSPQQTLDIVSSPSLHQRFVSKLLDPVSLPPANPLPRDPKYTPLELQVLELKAKHPDVLLMVEVGYKYRFFGEDAEVAARVLGIFAHVDHNFLTASVPTFRLSFHVRRLVGAGYKVGVVKQTETAAIKAHGPSRLGPFARGLSALYTKATIEAAEDMGGAAEEGIGSSGSNYLACVLERGVAEGGFDVRVGVVAVEVSTGEVIHAEFDDNVMRSGLEALVLSLTPSEILLGEPLSVTTEKLLLGYAGPDSNVRIERTSRACFSDGGALAEVMSLYENMEDATSNVEHGAENIGREEGNDLCGIEGIMAMPELAVQALALAIRYLKQFGFERILCLGALFRPFSSNIEMTLSANTLHQLEVLKNNSDGSVDGSLLQAMNHTSTTFGSRLLKHWVTHPLCDKNSIHARLDAITEIVESMGSLRNSQHEVDLDDGNSCNALMQPEFDNILSSVLSMLGKSPDIQRGITRIFHRTATPTELISVIHAILLSGKQLQKLCVEDDGISGCSQQKTVTSALLRRLILTASSSTVTGYAAKLLSSLDKDAANQKDMLGLFIASNNQFPEVARSRISVQLAEEKLNLLIGQYRKHLGIWNLEFVCVSGITHLIELPSNVRVPPNWAKVSSTKKTIRYHPPEVVTALEGLLLAKEELAVVCRTTWDSFLMGFSTCYAQFQAAVQALAALDCLHSLAILSKKQNYVRPIFFDNDEPCQIHISSGRHPVLESVVGDNFVPNDTFLNADGEYCQIVSGPNMGGKSCYIRQVALIALMAQVGSFVPASSAMLSVLDGIYTRMGASDSIQQGTSTFLEELNEASHLLHHCSSRSLVIIDELGRGTSTHDGVAIAYATLHYLLKEKKCMVLFVTHYPEIMDIQNEFEGSVMAYHVSYLTSQKPLQITDSNQEVSVPTLEQGELTFLYKVARGASDKSFGLNVARLAQLPTSCIARAAVKAAQMEMELTTRARNQAEKSMMRMPIQADSWGNIANPPGALIIEKEHFEELAEICHKIFFDIKAMFGDAKPQNILPSVKHARELALNMIKKMTDSMHSPSYGYLMATEKMES